MNKIKNKILKAFEDLSFIEETHSYLLKGKEADFTSVSNIIKKYHKEFNMEATSTFTAKKQNRAKEEIQKEWNYIRDTSIEKGNSVHKFAEDCFNGKVTDFSKVDNKFLKPVWEFFCTMPSYLKPLLSECKMYNLEAKIAGTADLLLYNELTKEVILVDYKSNKVLFKPVYNQLYPPFQRFGETPFNKYQIQLNLYQWILEQIKGIKISKRIIVHFTEDSFIPYAVEDLQKEIKLIVNNNFSNQLLWQPLVN